MNITTTTVQNVTLLPMTRCNTYMGVSCLRLGLWRETTHASVLCRHTMSPCCVIIWVKSMHFSIICDRCKNKPQHNFTKNWTSLLQAQTLWRTTRTDFTFSNVKNTVPPLVYIGTERLPSPSGCNTPFYLLAFKPRTVQTFNPFRIKTLQGGWLIWYLCKMCRCGQSQGGWRTLCAWFFSS